MIWETFRVVHHRTLVLAWLAAVDCSTLPFSSENPSEPTN